MISTLAIPRLEAKIFANIDQFNIDPGPVQVKRAQDLKPKIFTNIDQKYIDPGPVQVKRCQDYKTRVPKDAKDEACQ